MICLFLSHNKYLEWSCSFWKFNPTLAVYTVQWAISWIKW